MSKKIEWCIENLQMLKRLVKRLKEQEKLHENWRKNSQISKGIRIAIDAIEKVYEE